jgi:hypothetical protein
MITITMTDEEYYETLELVLMNHWTKKVKLDEAFAKIIVKEDIERQKKMRKKEEEEKEEIAEEE